MGSPGWSVGLVQHGVEVWGERADPNLRSRKCDNMVGHSWKLWFSKFARGARSTFGCQFAPCWEHFWKLRRLNFARQREVHVEVKMVGNRGVRNVSWRSKWFRLGHYFVSELSGIVSRLVRQSEYTHLSVCHWTPLSSVKTSFSPNWFGFVSRKLPPPHCVVLVEHTVNINKSNYV